ncbi:hypothetical protein [Streptomyces sp. NPDC004629]|uniref:hypothetical protein n=1 Tax=Streptomyces sp. NPDC004629 TaxID=3364705 RepID=UPI0036AEE799
MLVGWSREAFDKLRRGRNDAAHNHLFDTTKALEALDLCWRLGDLFDRSMGGKRTVAAFVSPTLSVEAASVDPEEIAELQEALEGHRRSLAESRIKLSEASNRIEAERRARAEALIESVRNSKSAYVADVARRQARPGAGEALPEHPRTPRPAPRHHHRHDIRRRPAP